MRPLHTLQRKHAPRQARLLAALLLSAATATALAEPPTTDWEILDLGPYHGRSLALNDHGWVVSWANVYVPVAQGYSVITLKNALGDTSNFWLTDINNDNRILGVDASGPMNVRRSFVQQGDERITLPTLPDYMGYHNATAYSLNDAGQVVGNTGDYGVRWDPLGAGQYAITPLGVPLGAQQIGSGDAVALNESGAGLLSQVYPTYRTGWSTGVGNTAVIPELPGYTPLGRDINNAHQVVGLGVYSCAGFSCDRPFVWQGNTVQWLPETLNTTGWINAHADALNDRGQVVGSGVIAPYDYRAMLWTQTGEGWIQTDLNTLLKPGSRFTQLTEARGINERGQILGIGADESGLGRIFLLSPVPEPSTWGMLLTGIATLAGLRRARFPRRF